jgi:hypothetical protein
MYWLLSKLGLMQFLVWIKPTLEGTDGKASFRRISALILMTIFVIGCSVVFKHTFEHPNNNTFDLMFSVLCLIALFFCVVTAIVSAQILTELVKSKGVNIDSKEIAKETEEILGQ